MISHLQSEDKMRTSSISRVSGSIIRFKRNNNFNHFSTRHTETEKAKRNWKQNGTPEILVGTAILVLVGVDKYLQRQQEVSKREIMLSLKAAVQKDEANCELTNGDRDLTSSQNEQLFDCVVRKIPKYFDGRESLKGVNVGDQVSVLQERVGPDGMYHLCRTKLSKGNDDGNVGWFPISCLEKLP